MICVHGKDENDREGQIKCHCDLVASRGKFWKDAESKCDGATKDEVSGMVDKLDEFAMYGCSGPPASSPPASSCPFEDPGQAHAKRREDGEKLMICVHGKDENDREGQIKCHCDLVASRGKFWKDAESKCDGATKDAVLEMVDWIDSTSARSGCSLMAA